VTSLAHRDPALHRGVIPAVTAFAESCVH
jgi:hypothetical protein